jgi:transcriptional regulator with XRE-family HTH domain
MREYLPANLRRLLDERGVSQTDLATAIGISNGTLSDWLSGRYYPRPKYIEAMAAFFNVPAAEITNEKKAPSSADDEALALFMALPDEAKGQALDYLRFLVHRREGGGN